MFLDDDDDNTGWHKSETKNDIKPINCNRIINTILLSLENSNQISLTEIHEPKIWNKRIQMMKKEITKRERIDL